jgi:signal transduction histidine kinase
MQVCLISNDQQLCKLVSGTARARIVCSQPGELPEDADVYLLDFDPALEPYVVPDLGRRDQIYLIDPKDLHSFFERTQGQPVRIVLKPVEPSALQAALDGHSQAVSAQADAEGFRADRDELLQNLLLANLKLQQHDQERTNFLARALHDLRTPLTSLRGVCGLLLDGEVGPLSPQQRELLERIQSSSGRLARLSSGMFELSIQGRVQRTLQAEPGNIETCINRSLQEICAVVQEKQLHMVTRTVPPPLAMMMDSQQVEQLLINLLENACKFTPRLGKIDLHGYPVCWDFSRSAGHNSPPHDPLEHHNAYRIDIKDSGPGIDPSMLEAIFEQYTSCSGAEDRSGGGLGLAICKLVASAHGGRVWATSNGEGATFSVVLPFDSRAAGGRRRHLTEEGRPRSAQAV